MPEYRMNHRDEFWSHLVAAGALDEALVDEMKEAVRNSPWKPLGAILVELGYMRFKQVAHLLRIQADEMHLRIGELAIREGYCSPRQIEDALAAQFERNPTPVGVLAKDERVDRDRLMDGLVRYIIELEASAPVSTTEAA